MAAERAAEEWAVLSYLHNTAEVSNFWVSKEGFALSERDIFILKKY